MISTKLYCFNLCAICAFSYLFYSHCLERLKGIVQNGKILGSCYAMIFPEEAGFATASKITVTEAFRNEFRKGVYRYAIMNLISMGQVHVQDYIGFKAVLAYPHISVLQNLHRSFSTTQL